MDNIAVAGTQETDLPAIVSRLKGKKDIALDLSDTQIKVIPEKTLVKCTALKEVILPKGLVSIGKSAFRECWTLTSIEIPETVTSIGKEAFDWCDSLASVSLGDTRGCCATRGSRKVWRRGSLHRV